MCGYSKYVVGIYTMDTLSILFVMRFVFELDLVLSNTLRFLSLRYIIFSIIMLRCLVFQHTKVPS